MTISPMWLNVTLACFVVVSLVLCGLLIGMSMALTRARILLDRVTAEGLPRLQLMTEEINRITDHVDRLAMRLETESLSTIPKVDHMFDRAEQALEMVENGSLRVNEIIEGTTDRINKVRHSPVTRPVLIGVGGLAAMRFLTKTFTHQKR